jgi:serine/threonine protein kinase
VIDEHRMEVFTYWSNECVLDPEEFIERIDHGRGENDAKVYDLLGLETPFQSDAATDKLSEILLSLTVKSEDTVQDALTEAWLLKEEAAQDCYAIDTHNANWNLPLFKFSQYPGESKPRSANPDCISCVAPIFLELKSLKGQSDTDENEQIYEVISQAIQRVHLCALQNENLFTVFAFATAGVKSWIVICKRDYAGLERGELLRNNYYLFPLNTSHIIPIWRSFNEKALVDPVKMFVHRNAFPLSELLASLGFHAGFCTIQFQTKRSYVYVITPGCERKMNTKTFLSTPEPSYEDSFVVKLSIGTDYLKRGLNELEILKQLDGIPAIDYVIATLDSNPYCVRVNKPDFFMKNHINFNSRKAINSVSSTSLETAARFKSKLLLPSMKNKKVYSADCQPRLFWWNYLHHRETDRYTAVIMHKAKDHLQLQSGALYKRLRQSLDEIHRKDVLHCDLRRLNLMEFSLPQKYFIIDFDVAVKFKSDDPDEKYLLDLSNCPGGQRSFIKSVKDLGETVPGKKYQYRWDKYDDQSMLNESLKTLDTERATTPFKAKPESLHRFDVSRHPAGEEPDEEDA